VSELDDAYAAAGAALRGAEGVLVATHEGPDGDAIGSLLGAVRGLRAAGIDACSFAPDEVPREYAWLGVTDVECVVPSDASRRVLLVVDCGSAKRVAAPPGVLAGAGTVVNVDHHHDNTRFGSVNVVDPGSSCAAMMVWRVLRDLGVALDAEIAQPLYVGAVTDTGRFQYGNTDAATLRFAAELVDAGARPHQVFTQVYENVPLAKLRLLAQVLDHVELRLDGRLAMTAVTRADYACAGATDGDSEGIIDHLRAVAGVEVAGVIRELPDGGPRTKVSLRSSPKVDVSAIARRFGGGGHPQAAGFSSDAANDEIVAAVEREVVALG
jgi:phosphoesterase RecJ-like protein